MRHYYIEFDNSGEIKMLAETSTIRDVPISGVENIIEISDIEYLLIYACKGDFGLGKLLLSNVEEKIREKLVAEQ